MSTLLEPARGRRRRSAAPWTQSRAARARLLLTLSLGLGGGALLAYQLVAANSPVALFLAAAVLLLALASPWLSLRRIDSLLARADARTDPRTGLYSDAGMLAVGEQLLSRARASDKPMSLAIFDFADLLEVRSIYGPGMRDLVVQRLVRDLRAAAGRSGAVGRTGRTEFTLLFPTLDKEDAQEAISAVFGVPARVEFERHGDEVVLVPDVLVRCAESSAPGQPFSVWHARASADLGARRDAELRRRERLARSREWHSLPPSIDASHVALAVTNAGAKAPAAQQPAGEPTVTPC